MPSISQRSRVSIQTYLIPYIYLMTLGFDIRMGLLCVRNLLLHAECTLTTSISYRQTEPIKRILPKNYAENYVYKPSELRIMRTK